MGDANFVFPILFYAKILSLYFVIIELSLENGGDIKRMPTNFATLTQWKIRNRLNGKKKKSQSFVHLNMYVSDNNHYSNFSTCCLLLLKPNWKNKNQNYNEARKKRETSEMCFFCGKSFHCVHCVHTVCFYLSNKNS